MASWLGALGLVGVLAVSGCASSGPANPDAATPPIALSVVLADEAYSASARAAVPGPQSVMALDAEMRALLEQRIQPALRRGLPVGALIEELTRDGRLRLDYDNERTLTAAEAFAARRGNCLSLVLMTAAFAESIGLDVQLQEVDEFQDWENLNDLTFVVGHVNLRLARERNSERHALGQWFNEWMTVDFLPGQDMQRQNVTFISRERLLAMFYNNRAAESLGRANLDEAYAYARMAIHQDPDFAHAYNTLGVIHRRKGLAAKAEQSWRMALQRDPGAASPTNNLALWLTERGQSAAAQALRAQQKAWILEQPLHLLSLGQRALASGQAAQAIAPLQRALRLAPRHHELHFTLAQAFAMTGDLAQTQRHLELARVHAGNAPLQARYSSKLQRLREAQGLPVGAGGGTPERPNS